MAQCKQSSQEFIKNAFTPQIAIMCTALAEKCCQKNNLSFIELLQPFSKVNSDVYYKDPTGNSVCIRNLKLTFLDINLRPPQATLARKFLNASVSDANEPRVKDVSISSYKLETPASTPWYEAWRDTFLKVQYPSDHEYTKHFLSCVLVVSSADNNPVETMVQLAQSLNQMQSSAAGKLPKWFSSNILKYYVVVHDNVEGNEAIAIEAFDSLKVSYGNANCFLLRMNSRPPGPTTTDHLPDPWSQFVNNQIKPQDFQVTPESSPNFSRNLILEIAQEANETKNALDYHPLSPENDDLSVNKILNEIPKMIIQPAPIPKSHGACLSTEDIEQVKLLISDFLKGCLVPYVERQISMLNDVISNKKGMSKSLFSATKRWFTPNKPGASSVAVNNLIYATDSVELQVRRLGDLYFMFGHYTSAFQVYHLGKRDYNTDQAWLYYAGALEMAALSAFMANDSNRKTYDYMEDSITTYLNTCKMPQFATRATILSFECLKSKHLYGEAALQLIRMTSEESDLRSALLLEQAAYCFLQSKMIRKYAFHMVLAGHRFSKAAQRKHSLRSYKQAYQIYDKTGWDLACDHIHYTIGRQANNLQQFSEAVQSFSELLRGGSKQSAQQQEVYLKEYLTILTNKLKKEDSNDLPSLPVPELDVSSLKVLVGPTRPLKTPGKIAAYGINISNAVNISEEVRWHKLEEMLVVEAGSAPMVFKPMVTLYNMSKLEKGIVTAIVNEPIQISIQIVNTLQTVLNLKDIYLIWKFVSAITRVEVCNESAEDTDHLVKTHFTKSAVVEGNMKHELILSLTPLATGLISVIGVSYSLIGSCTSDAIFIKGKQLIHINQSDSKKPKLLQINVVPAAPCLQVTFSEVTLEFLTNELQKVSIDLKNTGTVPLRNIYMATSVPHLLCNSEFRKHDNFVDHVVDADTPAQRDKLARKNHITSVPLPGDCLVSGQGATIHIWVKAPPIEGPASIDLLIYYENTDPNSVPRYRLVRHNWNLTVQESIFVEVTTQGSFNSKDVEELALAIKATNLNKVHQSISTELRLLNVGLLSKYWKLTKDIVTPKYINLSSQESAHILLKAKRTVHGSSQYSNIPLTSDTNVIQNVKGAYLAFAKKSEQYSINAFESYDTYNKSRALNKDGILLLQWQALVTDANVKRIVNGQSQVPVEINRLKEEEYQLEKLLSDTIDISDSYVNNTNELERAKKQVMYNLLHPAVVQHDFASSKICTVSVTLLLHSIIHDASLAVTVNTLGTSGPSSVNRSNLFYSNASNQFRWLGNGKIIRTLKPLSTDSVQLSVAFSGPGTYDLGAHLQVLCQKRHKHSDDDFPTVQSCQIQSALVVVDANS